MLPKSLYITGCTAWKQPGMVNSSYGFIMNPRAFAVCLGVLLGAHDEIFFGCPITDFLPLDQRGLEHLREAGSVSGQQTVAKKKGSLKRMSSKFA